jgi:hypothetical protein
LFVENKNLIMLRGTKILSYAARATGKEKIIWSSELIHLLQFTLFCNTNRR